MTTLEIIFIALIILTLIAGLFLGTLNRRLDRQLSELVQAQKDQKAKAEFMIRELNKVYGEAKNKTYCLGNIDALRWVTGELQDGNYWGFLMARKQASKGGK